MPLFRMFMRRNPPVTPDHIQIAARDVFDERAAARPALDVNGVSLRASELAILDTDIANPAGSFAADPDAGEDRVRQCAVGDEDVLTGPEKRERFAAAPGLNRDTVVAGRDVAAIDADVFAGIDIDPVPVTAGAAYGEIAYVDVLAIRGVKRPHETVFGGEILEAQIGAADGLDQGGMAQRVLVVGTTAERGIPHNPSRPDDSSMVSIHGVNQGHVPLYPFALPADLRHRIIAEIGSAEQNRVLLQTEQRIGSEGDGARKIIARRNQRFASAQRPAAVEGLLDGAGIFRPAVADGPKIADIEDEYLLCRTILRPAGSGEGRETGQTRAGPL